jgi:hypothetical protein
MRLKYPDESSPRKRAFFMAHFALAKEQRWQPEMIQKTMEMKND